ncbi:dinucleotide-utilizing protein [Nonomuraea mesophila]|uniref:Dinucleotide-utilizing protein n=2 Tax=Nonomuraea mesophila TaxID=2530382 RepID=A0A4R5FY53_9ACTN|nr:dinucleotide-utilizing protein [Nonomuraea mesophila]
MKYPRIKYTHRPRLLAGGRVSIGGIVFGLASEFNDPEHRVWALLNEMDGTRTREELVARMAETGADEKVTASVIDTLAAAGHVEDADPDLAENLTQAERDRYDRGRAFFSWVDKSPRSSPWHAQERLRSARAVVVGVGGTGAAAAAALTMSGVGHVHCVEPDVVELSNLNRQIIYTESDIGRSKVEVAVEQLRARNSAVAVSGERRSVNGPDDLKQIAGGFDVLVLSADRPDEIRYWANEACLATGTPWVHGGYHGPQVSCGVFLPGTGPCYACVQRRQTERRAGRDVVAEWEPGKSTDPVNAANAVSAMVSGGLLAHLALSVITGAPPIPANRIYAHNLMVMDHAFALSASGADGERCDVCGGGGPDETHER